MPYLYVLRTAGRRSGKIIPGAPLMTPGKASARKIAATLASAIQAVHPGRTVTGYVGGAVNGLE